MGLYCAPFTRDNPVLVHNRRCRCRRGGNVWMGVFSEWGRCGRRSALARICRCRHRSGVIGRAKVESLSLAKKSLASSAFFSGSSEWQIFPICFSKACGFKISKMRPYNFQSEAYTLGAAGLSIGNGVLRCAPIYPCPPYSTLFGCCVDRQRPHPDRQLSVFPDVFELEKFELGVLFKPSPSRQGRSD